MIATLPHTYLKGTTKKRITNVIFCINELQKFWISVNKLARNGHREIRYICTVGDVNCNQLDAVQLCGNKVTSSYAQPRKRTWQINNTNTEQENLGKTGRKDKE